MYVCGNGVTKPAYQMDFGTVSENQSTRLGDPAPVLHTYILHKLYIDFTYYTGLYTYRICRYIYPTFWCYL